MKYFVEHWQSGPVQGHLRALTNTNTESPVTAAAAATITTAVWRCCCFCLCQIYRPTVVAQSPNHSSNPFTHRNDSQELVQQ
eukprot:14734-Heterococcus_DN1.PRE.1